MNNTIKHISRVLPLIILMFIQPSCNEYTFNMDEYNNEIVIDGSIEPGKKARVILTKSAPYFGETDSTTVRNYALTRAKVTLSTSEEEEVLTLQPNYAFFPPYVYVSTRMVGETGQEYLLTVEYGGKKVFARTTIPNPVNLEDIKFKLENHSDSLGSVGISFIDNEESRDYYFIMSKTLNKDSKFKPVLFPDFSDDSFNGKRVEISLLRGAEDPAWINDEVYYELGDTILVKFCTIDKSSFDFWNSFLKEIKNTSNPFSSTNAHVKSNVTNGLGIWCGYGSTYYQVIAR